MRFDNPDNRPTPDLWPDKCYTETGEGFWVEESCFCDNGDLKPHLPRCDWYPREQALFACLHNDSTDANFQRIAAMNPEEFAAAFPLDRNVAKQRQRQQGENTHPPCAFCKEPSHGAVIRIQWPWEPLRKVWADEEPVHFEFLACLDCNLEPAVWRGRRWPVA